MTDDRKAVWLVLASFAVGLIIMALLFQAMAGCALVIVPVRKVVVPGASVKATVETPYYSPDAGRP